MPSKPVHRPISRAEFAALRAHLQGVALRDVADRYLSPDMDLRVAKSTLRRIIDAVKVLAQRHGRKDVVRLAQLRLPQASANSAPAALSLEDFRKQRDPESFYTERELIDLYQDEYKDALPDRKQKRDQRLRDRQLTALQWAEAMLVSDPCPTDPVAAWLPAHWAKRLKAAGYVSLADLAAFIDKRGTRWWTEIDGLGERSATQIVQFLATNADVIGITLSVRALIPRGELAHQDLVRARVPAVGIVPIESLVCPTNIDGSQGSNRAPADTCQLTASNDLAAIEAWLALYAESSNTYRAYRKEAERLLLWSIFEARKPLSSLSLEDCHAYRNFLSEPDKPLRWAGKRGAERWSPDWRPFEQGPLSPASVSQAMAIATLLCGWLTEMRYLAGNPFAGLVTRQRTRGRNKEERLAIKAQRRDAGFARRSLSQSLWDTVSTHLSAKPDTPPWARARWIVHWGQSMGLRAREMVEAQVADIRRYADPDGGEPVFALFVLGKGDEDREVAFPAHLWPLLSAHFRHRGLDAEPLKNPGDTFLIGRLPPASKDNRVKVSAALAGAGISYEALYKAVVNAFDDVRREANSLTDEEVDVLERASTHWLRHCFGTHSLARGVNPKALQSAMGHASQTTTDHYAVTDIVDQAKALRR